MARTQIKTNQAENEFLTESEHNAIISGAHHLSERVVRMEVDFGFPNGLEGDTTTTTVQASWITSDSVIICVPSTDPTVDHSGEDVVIENITAYPSNIIAGVSFDIVACAPRNTWGRYLINCLVSENLS